MNALISFFIFGSENGFPFFKLVLDLDTGSETYSFFKSMLNLGTTHRFRLRSRFISKTRGGVGWFSRTTKVMSSITPVCIPISYFISKLIRL